MGLFNRKRKNPEASTPVNDPVSAPDHSGNKPGIFSENGSGLDAIYAFLQSDHEARGYSDALTNPDESYKNDNIRLIRQDLMILIDRTVHHYETMIKEADYHISTRSRAGLIDLVDELKMKKELLQKNIEKINQIKAEASSGNGAGERIVLSYQRGFMRGLYAISQSKLFNGNM